MLAVPKTHFSKWVWSNFPLWGREDSQDSISWLSLCGHMTWFWPRRCKWKQCVQCPRFLKATNSILTHSSFLLPEMWAHWMEPQQSPWAIRGPWEEKPSTVETQAWRIRVPDAHRATLPSLPPSRFLSHERKITSTLIYSCLMIFSTPQLPHF